MEPSRSASFIVAWRSAALSASALRDKVVARGTILIGEIGLTGELRPVNGLDRRLKEAARLGFGRAIAPNRIGRHAKGPDQSAIDLEIVRVSTLREALGAALGLTVDRRSETVATAIPVGGPSE